MVESPLLTVSEMATLLRVNTRTVQRMCDRGDLPAFRVNRQWRIDTSGTITTPRDDSVRGEHPVSGRIR